MISESDVRAALKRTLDSNTPDGWDVAFDFLEDAVDSLDHATFLLDLEETCGLKVPEDEVMEIKSIQAVLEYAAQATADAGR